MKPTEPRTIGEIIENRQRLQRIGLLIYGAICLTFGFSIAPLVQKPPAPQQLAAQRSIESAAVPIETWTGAQARQRTAKNVKPIVADDVITMINGRVRRAVASGHWELIDPLNGVGRQIDLKTADAVRAHYEQHGYRWETMPDPDPYNPRGRPYDVLSWHDGAEPK